ncbi:MAG TPA: methylmalonyl Co-A mutase-associated GTPase MeaB [Cyclobacteriaceae bacterium]|nr:methylmalonyl Co-A mutase-associated GTPase MeaB [Cyclobacteriaceae bacterium]
MSATNEETSNAELLNAITAGDRAALARAITLCESTLETDRKRCEGLLKALLPRTGNSIRIGITGVPGVGKSTFIEAFGELVTKAGNKVAVLAIDPTSQKTRGSILGDKTRMNKLSRNENVFIRPSPSGTALGGVSFQTREAILLCEAAGFNVIIIETVGVGQSETIIKDMVDFFLLLMLAGAGDELQGIKKGIMEMADLVAINKADGANVKASLQAKADVQSALHLQANHDTQWQTKVLTISSTQGNGIEEVWKSIQDHKEITTERGYFQANRQRQQRKWLEESIENQFREWIQGPSVIKEKDALLDAIMQDKLLPSEAARKFWNNFRKV